MTATPKTQPSIRYPQKTVLRAERAMLCAPLTLNLFATMVFQSVSLAAIAGPSGLTHNFTRRLLSERTAEAELLWLIQVGLLRREVDGQGLTDSFRITPLGRQLVQKWQTCGPQVRYAPTLRDRLYNALSRWFKPPF